MLGLIQPVQLLARAAGDATRASIGRAALIGAALLIAILGAGFLILAAYLGLRFLLGPGLAALVIVAGGLSGPGSERPGQGED